MLIRELINELLQSYRPDAEIRILDENSIGLTIDGISHNGLCVYLLQEGMKDVSLCAGEEDSVTLHS